MTIHNNSLNTINNKNGRMNMAEKEQVTMRTPFPSHQISKLPKPTKQQTDEVRADYTKGIRCAICGGWHHPKVVHLDYVGHAALTDRLLDVDERWTWEPLALDSQGMPSIDKDGGLWIRLTVLGVTRLGYGDAQGKTGGDAMKERIGDALRNAAMRFGAALDLWHKGDLHINNDDNENDIKTTTTTPISGVLDAYEKSNPEDLKYLRELAAELVQMVEVEDNPKAAYEHKQKAMLDTEQTLALWAILAPNSKTRNKIKAVANENK